MKGEITRMPQSGDCVDQKIPISESLEDKKKLTLLVKRCYETLNTYGKSPEQLESSVMLMQMVLGEFDYDAVRGAFMQFLQVSSDMPKPADIIGILEPEKKVKKWCAVTFGEIKRRIRHCEFVSSAEHKYCADFVAAKVGD